MRIKGFIVALLLFACNHAFSQTGHTQSFDAATFPPTGWTVNGGTYSTTTYLNRVTSTTSVTATPHSGAGFCRFRCTTVPAASSANLFTPKIDYSNRGANTPTVSLWVYRDVNSSFNTATFNTEGVNVYVNTSTTSTFTGATLLGFIPRRGGLAASGTYLTTATNLTVAAPGWYEYSFNIPAAYTACAYIGLKFVSAAGLNIYVDDINYTSYPNLPACANLSSPSNGATGLSPINPSLTLNWSAPSACCEFTGYKLYLGTDAAATNILNGISVGYATTTYTPATLAANTTYYWKVVPVNPVGDASGCTIRWFRTGLSNPCSAGTCCGGGNDGGGTPYDWITDVVIGSINRSYSFYEGYANTGYSTNVYIGTNYPLAIYSTGNQWNYAFVYADWNQDGDFSDANETVASYVSGTWNLSTSLTPPAGALLGSTTMRIMLIDDTDGWFPPSPAGCSDVGYGEVEDYTLTVCNTQITTQPSASYITCATIGSQAITAVTTGATSHQWQYSANGTTGWSNVANNTPAGATYTGGNTASMTVAGITTGSTTHYYRLNAVGPYCTATSNVSALTVRTISTDPTSLTAPSYTICPGNSSTLTINGGSKGFGASWKWYTTSCGTGLLTSTASNVLVVTPATTTTYYARAEGSCNNTACVSATIVVGGAPTTDPVSTTATSPICNGGATTLRVTNPTTLGAGSSWVWYTGSCGGTQVGSGNPFVISPTSTTTYWVRAEGCNFTNCVSRSVTVNNIPSCSTLNTPYNNETGVCRSFTLDWDPSASSPLSGYKLFLGTDAAATNVLNGVNQGFATSYTSSVLLPNTRYYWKVVPWNTCGDATGCSIRSFVTGTTICNCWATTSGGGGIYDYISQVYVGDINRSSGYEGGYPWTYTGYSTNVIRNSAYTLDVYMPGNRGNYVSAYADWNQDGDFVDAGETVINGVWCTWNTSATFTVSASATIGYTTLRIMQWDDTDGYAPSPAGCGDIGPGDIEDYELIVCDTKITTQPAASYAICAGIGTQTLSAVTTGATSHQWEFSTNGTSWSTVANNTPAGAVYTNANTANMTISGITTGPATYYYRLKAMSVCTIISNTTVLWVRTISTDPTTLTASHYTVCPGNSQTLTINGGSKGFSANWKWYTGGCGTGLLTTTSSNSLVITPGSTTTYYARAEGFCNNTNCVSTTMIVGGTPNTAPTSVSASANPICNGGTTTLTVNGGALGAGGLWKWYSGSCGGTYVGTGNPIAVSPTVTTTYYARAEGCDITTCAVRTITVNNIPSATTPIAPFNGAGGQCRNALLTWNDVTNESGYKIYLGTDAGATNILNGVNQGWGLSFTCPVLAANTTYYWKAVPWNSCGNATGGTIRSFTTGTDICYCTPSSTASGYNYIEWVDMGSISNGSVDWDYADYSNLSTSVIIGTSYNLWIYSQNDAVDNFCRVFIDWNQDADFTDVGELVLDDWGNHTYTASITPPVGAGGGNTRMRIVLTDYLAGYNLPDGCGDNYAGEIEDYMLNVCPVTITTQPGNTAACVSSGSGNLTITATSASSYQWQYKNGASWGNVTNGVPAGSSYTNQTTSNMTVAGIGAIGNYQYRCNVIGSCTITSNPCTLTVINTVPTVAAYTFPGNGAVNQCATSFTSLNWNAATNSPASYKLYFGTNAAATNIVNGTNIGNVLTYNPLPLSANTTYYWKVVPTNNCGDAVGAPTYSFTTGSTCYCVPNYTSDACNLNMHISNFTTTGGVTNISNSSGCVPASSSYYADYSSMNVSVISGNAFNFSVTQPSLNYNMGFRIWIDYNNDFDFADAGEDVWNSGTTGKVFTGTIIVPAGTSAGTKRMRVRNRYNALPATTDYCSTLSYGETEDYGLIVIAPCSAPTTQAASIILSGATCTQMSASWTNGNGTKRILVAKAGSAVTGVPANGMTYTGNSVFGAGSFIATGEYIVYDGTSNNVTVTGLTAGATYHYKVFEYNCTPGWEQFLTTSPPSASLPTNGSVAPVAGPNQYLCSPTSTAVMAGSGTGTWTFISGPNTPNIVNPTSPTTQIGTTTGLISGTYIFRWTGPCGNIYDDVMIIRQ